MEDIDIVSPLLLINKKCATHSLKAAKENEQFKKTKTLISNSY